MDYKRVKNDVNGNPRYVFHFLEFIGDNNKAVIKTLVDYSGLSVAQAGYITAVKKSRQIGGKKYTGKDFGGGIVLQSYNITDTINQIKKLKNE